jgi:haloalkane dehalogenase
MPHRFYLDLPHGQLHGRIARREGAPWLVLLHQSPSSSAMFEDMIGRLSPHYAILAPDNPGFGMSDPMDAPSVAGFASVVAAAMQAHGVPRAALFGHHTGAAVAAALASSRSDLVRALILSGPPVLDTATRAALPGMAPADGPLPDGSHFLAMWQRLRARETTAPPELSTREVSLAMLARRATPAVYAAVSAHDTAADLRAATCPVMLMAGERDSLIGCLPLAAAACPQARVERLDDAGGYCCEMASDRVCALVRDFLESCAA